MFVDTLVFICFEFCFELFECVMAFRTSVVLKGSVFKTLVKKCLKGKLKIRRHLESTYPDTYADARRYAWIAHTENQETPENQYTPRYAQIRPGK